jgi:methylthioribose-1-phosphate isomerase
VNVGGQPLRPLRPAPQRDAVLVIDQRLLPHRLHTERLASAREVFTAIRDMWVRGAPLIGATAAYGLALGLVQDGSDRALEDTAEMLQLARPTAVNLAWALQRMLRVLRPLPAARRAAAAWDEADAIAEEDVAVNAAIGRHGLALLQAIAARRPGPVNVLTHCNAGWLATVDWGTATSPIYQAHAAGLPVHVWVDETRPRNQGASLTAWELGQAGVPHTLVADNAGGHLMQHGQVDICIVGCDRVTARGDACNKIGTYLKALAAHDNGVPFYVAMPTSTLDLSLADGLREIPIEERSPREVTHLSGLAADGRVLDVCIAPVGTAATNPAFDVTPARLLSGLITEHGIVAAVRRLDALGMNRGSTGNLSHRCGAGMLITPTGMGADELRPQDLVWLGWDGTLRGDWQPSSEWHFHQAIYLARPQLHAVVHTHSTHAAALACLRRALPAFHYMVAVAGGDSVPCVPYHLFGTEALSRAVATAFADRDACLMANHGLVAGGPTLAKAMKVVQEIESLCEVYLKALAVGEPALLSQQEMAQVIERFSHYGKAARAAG